MQSMSIRAKILVEKKFWIILDNGIKTGTLRFINEDAYEYVSNGDSELLTEESLYRTFGKNIFQEIKIAVATSDKEDCFDYPTDFEVIHNKEKVGYTDPAVLLCCCFTKTKTSTNKYCAGYFGLRFAHKWVKSFCPKLETVFKYEFIGPYKSEDDLLIAMRHKEQCEEHPERV